MSIEVDIIEENNQLRRVNEELNNLLVDKEKELDYLKENNKLVKQQNEILKEIIKKHNINNNINIPSPPTSPEKVINNIFNENFEKNKIFTQPEFSNIKINKENILNQNKKICINKIEMFIAFLKFKKTDYYKNRINKINSLSPIDITEYKDIGGKNRNRRGDKNLPILKRYPIIVYDDIGNSVIKQLIAKETELIICYKNDIAYKIKKNVDNITINNVVDYIAKHDGLSYQKKGKIKYLFERCEYLYKQYAQYNKLNKFKFNIGSLQHMSKKEWEEWVTELDKLVKEYYSDENICQHIMANNSKKPGQKCGKVDCKKHSTC
jgi:hypothetical protein